MKYSEKTIPYRLSPAELENLRILRLRTQSSSSILDGEEPKRNVKETDICKSDPGQLENRTGDNLHENNSTEDLGQNV